MEYRKINLEELEKLKNLYVYENFEEIKKQIIDDISNGIKDIYVITENENLIGEITVTYKSDLPNETIPDIRVYLSAFRVHKDYQDQGLGQKLLKYVISELENKGITEFTVGVEDDNENAKHIYEKFDFTEIIDRGEETVKGRTYQYNLLLRKSNTKKMEKLIKKFDLGSQIIKVTQIHGGLSNRLYRVETDQAKYAIKKLNKTLMQNKAEFERIIFAEKVARIAEENGILVVRALEFENKIIHKIDGDYYMIFNWNYGSHIQPEDVTDEICNIIGELLAKIHNLDFSKIEAEKSKEMQIRTIDWNSLAKIAKEQNKYYYKDLVENIEILYEINKKTNEALEYAKSNLIISHRDLIKKNILWNNNIPTVIDWESSGYVNPTVELVQVCWNWANGDVGKFEFEKFEIIVNSYLQNIKNYKKEDMKKLIYANLWEAIEWLEYNLKRSLCIESTYRKEEIELAEEQINYLNYEIRYAMTQIKAVADSLQI
ncbi:aminoglycoside phosphotransferase [Clostridium sp. CAG:354]|jgi:Ser/Thr protein kinase RdoA (MazF antagonist)/GNAT superfamily N-acetyltransferase|nr:GNAT family N-acetyltransferase [Clostridium sp.]MEE0269669.1 GNAT family N-acetyltransferase [Clostridia bacterium]CDE10656.1 aminoglycoside phosphotransferase [Clostridium sp. CAG:354]